MEETQKNLPILHHPPASANYVILQRIMRCGFPAFWILSVFNIKECL